MNGNDKARARAARRRRSRRLRFVRNTYNLLTTPLAIIFLTYSIDVHPAYRMSWPKRMGLGFRFWRNVSRVRSGTSWRAHLVMAMKLLEMPPEVEGCVVECGCWKGGATVNLSIVCAITGRKLKVYDSFEGLPEPVEGDPIAAHTYRDGFVPGYFAGALDEVRGNVEKYGAIDSCEFIKGWFEDTTPHHEGNIVLAFWDVDFYSSLHDCLINLWNHIVDGGYVFLDEYKKIPYCAVFYSEKYWARYFNTVPPGLIGIGTGVQVGMFFTNPYYGMNRPKIQGAESTAYCVKGTRAIWEFYPDEMDSAAAPAAVTATADEGALD